MIQTATAISIGDRFSEGKKKINSVTNSHNNFYLSYWEGACDLIKENNFSDFECFVR